MESITANWTLEDGVNNSVWYCGAEGEELTLSPAEVRIDMALGTSKAVFCFFTKWMQETGITT